MFWYAGACVGSTVLAGKRITDAFSSGVSTVGGVCTRAFRPKQTPVMNAVGEERAPNHTRGGLVAGVARILNVTLLPITMVSAQMARVKRVTTAEPRPQRDQPILTPARPVVKAATPPAKPVSPLKPVTPRATASSDRRGKATFLEVRPEEAETAEFATSVQKIVFRRALAELSRPEPASRVHAAAASGGIRHPLSVRALAAQLSRDESPEVRRACLAALAAIGMEEGFPAAEHALGDTDASVRVAAVIAVYRLRGPRGADGLARMLRDPDAEVRRVAVTCIGWLRQVDLSGRIAPLLNDDSVHVRLSAVEAISNLRGYEAIPALVERLGDPVESVRRKALTVLQEITGKKMGEHYPEDDAEREVLMARWRHWWREEAER